MLKKLLWLLPALLCLTSCATIFTKKEYSIKLTSNKVNARARINDSTYTLPAAVKVKRSKEDLRVTLISDTITKEYTILSVVNPQFVYGNLLFLDVWPAAYITDLTNPKRFYYGKKAQLNDYDTITVINPSLFKWVNRYFSKRYPTHKGQVNFTASVPLGNLFYLQPRNEPVKNKGGFLGVSIGAEYFYKDNKFIRLSASFNDGYFFPVLLPVEHFDERTDIVDDYEETTQSYNFTLTDNYSLQRFTLGYGLSYAIYKWQIINNDYKFPSTGPEPRIKYSHAFGLSFAGHYQLSRQFFAGVVYTPTFYNTFPAAGYKYQHTLSFGVMFKFTPHK